MDETPPSYEVVDVVDTSDRTSPFLFVPSECLSVGIAASGNKSYVTVALGTTSSTGGPVVVTAEDEPKSPKLMTSSKILASIKGKDKTVIKISILNINNGKVVRTFQPRPKPNQFFPGSFLWYL